MATFRLSRSNTCPASAHPMRRPHAIIFRPFRSSPNSSTMHFIRASQPLTLPRYALSSRHRTAGRFTASHAHLDFAFPVGISAPSPRPEHLAFSSSALPSSSLYSFAPPAARFCLAFQVHGNIIPFSLTFRARALLHRPPTAIMESSLLMKSNAPAFPCWRKKRVDNGLYTLFYPRQP